MTSLFLSERWTLDPNPGACRCADQGDFTRTGKRTKRGVLQDGLNSAFRYIINNFVDDWNQVRAPVQRLQ